MRQGREADHLPPTSTEVKKTRTYISTPPRAFTGEWRKLHNEGLRDLYSSPSLIRIIKSRMIRWAGHVALIREKRNAYRLFVGNPERR
jgi:hypothetical protein